MYKCLKIYINVLGILYATLFFQSNIYSQKSDELRKLREKKKKEMEITETMIDETRSKKGESISMINIINKKIDIRDSYIKNIGLEIKTIEKELQDIEKLIESLRNDLIKIKVEYARLIYNAYKNRRKKSILIYIWASKSFNQTYKRVKYTQMYSEYKRKQRRLIEAYKKVLIKKIDELKNKKIKREILLKDREYEKFELIKEKEEQKNIIKKLKEREKELIKELEDNKKLTDKLLEEIKKVIEAENKKIGEKNIYASLTPEEKLISKEFEINRGKLPWPTSQGVVTGHFGIQKHPVFENINIRNDGIFINTIINEDARTVFDGLVAKVFSFPGSNYTILIKHGNYYSLYNNLIKVYVKEGERVSTKQKIGRIFTDYDRNETVLHFQVWKEKEKNDPEYWLSK